MGATTISAIQQAQRRAQPSVAAPPTGIPQQAWQAHLAQREAAAALAITPVLAMDDVAAPGAAAAARHGSRAATHLQQLTADLERWAAPVACQTIRLRKVARQHSAGRSDRRQHRSSLQLLSRIRPAVLCRELVQRHPGFTAV